MNTSIDWNSAREKLRPRVAAAVLDELYARSDRRAALYVAATAFAIAAIWALNLATPRPWILLPSIVLIGALQHHLSIIHHEAVHYLLFRSRFINELVGTAAASVVGFTMAYRTHHLQHHRLLGQPEDPDLEAYVQYPVKRPRLILNILWHLCGGAAIVQFIRQSQRSRAAAKTGGATAPLQLFGIALAQLFLLGFFALLGRPDLYFLLWLVPLLTVAKTLTHVRSVVEHTVGAAPDGRSTRYRTILCGPVERFFFAPMNFNYHAEHHFYPAIPYHHLADAHRALADDPVYRERVQLRDGYLRFLWGEAGSAVTSAAGPS